MNDFLEILLESFIDSIKMLPFLLLMFFLIEYLEHRAGKRTIGLLTKSSRLGPVMGSVLGVLPQCGFSVLASGLYAKRLITIGTLLAVFISTSDEAILILLYRPELISQTLLLMGVKVVIAIGYGYLIDAVLRSKADGISGIQHEHDEHCHDHCGCSCNSGGMMFKNVVLHSLKVLIYIFVATLILSLIVTLVGEDTLASLMLKGSLFQPVVAALIGLIPNCAASVIIAEVYADGMISLGSLLSGLISAVGVGLLMLFRSNKSIKDSLIVLGLLVGIAVVSGLAADLIALL